MFKNTIFARATLNFTLEIITVVELTLILAMCRKLTITHMLLSFNSYSVKARRQIL